ncbi:Ion channel, partial [Oesophagostomum dentatum]
LQKCSRSSNTTRPPTHVSYNSSIFQALHVREDVCEKFKKVKKVPRWLRILKTIYHDYGLKHICLISVLIIYQFIGAGVFYLCEAGFDESKEKIWNMRIAENRTKFVYDIIPLMFNNTDYLFFLTQEQTNEVSLKLHTEMRRYEKQLGIKYTDQKIKWDFWNAMLYAQTICTTIGYGHLYPSTVAGRVFTMIYAIFGIPLVLSILDDLGKLLTRCLKTPWWLIKCACRRMFRYCTKQTMAEIKKLDEEDKRGLGRIRLSPSQPSVVDIEALEELEDRIALGQASQLDNTVRFRSRYS